MARSMKCSDTGKTVYFSAARAQQSAAVYSVKEGVPILVYKCPKCGFHHLTKQRALDRKLAEGLNASN